MEYGLAHNQSNLETLMEIHETSCDLVTARFVVYIQSVMYLNQFHISFDDE